MSSRTRLKINIVVGGRFHAGQLYCALVSLGHDVHIYASSPARYFDAVPSCKITFIPKLSQLLQKGFQRRMPRWLLEMSSIYFDIVATYIMRPADIVWGFNGDSLYAGQKIKASGGVYILDRACPHILTQTSLLRRESISVGYPYSPLTKRLIGRFLAEYSLADAIVVPSEYSAVSFLDRGFSKDRIHKAPLDSNAPKPSDVSIAKIKALNCVSGRKFYVGMVGGSFLRKGLIYLLRAIASLDRLDIQLVVRADPTSLMRHKESRILVERLGVIFVPYLDDINSFYQSLDCFILPSVDEGFGMVLYEALSNGTPVIATEHVGAIDNMKHGVDFLRVPVADARSLATAITTLADNPAERRKIGCSGKMFYESRVSGGGQYKKCIEQVLSRF